MLERLTGYLRARRLIPNEQSTEDLIRFMVDQAVARSPVQVPEQIVDEFWQFFEELFSSPELKGLGELSLDGGTARRKPCRPPARGRRG